MIINAECAPVHAPASAVWNLDLTIMNVLIYMYEALKQSHGHSKHVKTGKLRNTSQHPLISWQPFSFSSAQHNLLHTTSISLVATIPVYHLCNTSDLSANIPAHGKETEYAVHHIIFPLHMQNFPIVSLAPEECFTHGQEVDKPSVGPQWLWTRLHTQYRCPQLPITSSRQTIFQSNILCVRDS